MPGLEARFAEITTPITAVSATDDLWASPASRDAFMSAYRNADYRAVTIDPQTQNLRPLGHMGYFRPHAEPLWQDALDWFEQLNLAARAA